MVSILASKERIVAMTRYGTKGGVHMTAWLSGWLRDIVLIILLATFVDLLIPNNSLQRYVKVVVSLIILLTILSPVISFLNAEKTIHQAIKQASGTKDGSQALSLILSDGAKLKSENEQRSTLLVEQQAGKVMKENLKKLLSLGVQEVVVTISEEEGAPPSIERVHVFLQSDKNSNSESQLSASAEQRVEIKQISPVSVDVEVDSMTQEASTANNEQATKTQSQLAIEEKVAHYLASQWGLTEDRIQVEWR
jgi:stage III sporulation protein AF